MYLIGFWESPLGIRLGWLLGALGEGGGAGQLFLGHAVIWTPPSFLLSLSSVLHQGSQRGRDFLGNHIPFHQTVGCDCI